MIKQLVELADNLDKKGYHKLAGEVDSILKKVANHDYSMCDKASPTGFSHGWYSDSKNPDGCPKCAKDNDRRSEIEEGLGRPHHTHRGGKSDR
jgi:hypothetical protein